jgi:hypothetical protein
MSVYNGFTCPQLWTVTCGVEIDELLTFGPSNIFLLSEGATTTSCAWPAITLASATADSQLQAVLANLEHSLMTLQVVCCRWKWVFWGESDLWIV